MSQISFERMPAAIGDVLTQLSELRSEVKALRESQPINEPPIDSKTLCERLGISHVTLIKLRKSKRIPYIQVAGNYRFNYQLVLKALNNRKK